MEVTRLTLEQHDRWDAFVRKHPHGTFFHLCGWKTAVERAFGHSMYYLVAEEDGEIKGVLPLGRVKSRLFGDALISTPFAVYGGVLADSEAAAVALNTQAEKLATELGVDYLEYRNREPRNESAAGSDLYVTFRKEIHAETDENMKAIPRKQRAMVRKGIKAGLVGEVDDGVQRFYPMYAESVRNLGTPVFSKHWFQTLKDVFQEDCEVLTITHEGVPVSSVLSFYFKNEVLPYYGGGTLDARALKANDFMYWELMCRASDRGITVFDYGRSKCGAGFDHVKKNWGFEPESMYYEQQPVAADTVPEVNPTNPKYSTAIKLWKRLPLPVANTLGPMVSKYLA